MQLPFNARHRLPLVALATLLASGPNDARAADAESERLAATGERILAEQCARCHAMATVGESPLAAAPPFRTLSRKYPLDSLAEALAEGITTGHPDMPERIFSTDEIAAILTYIERISAPPAGK